MRYSLSSHDEVAHLWAHQTQSHGYASNVRFDGRTIYSYGMHFPVATFVEPMRALLPKRLRERSIPVTRVCLFTSEGYGSSTAGHKSLVRSAIPPDVITFETAHQRTTDPVTRALATVLDECARIDDERTTMLSARTYMERRAEWLRDRCQKLALFMDVFRGELNLDTYKNADLAHRACGEPIHEAQDGSSRQINPAGTIHTLKYRERLRWGVGTPREWLARARLLIRTNGLPTIGNRITLARKIAREKTADARAERRARMERASRLRYQWRYLMRLIRNCKAQGLNADEASASFATAVPGEERAQAYHSTGTGGWTTYGCAFVDLPEPLSRKHGAYLAGIVKARAIERTQKREAEHRKRDRLGSARTMRDWRDLLRALRTVTKRLDETTSIPQLSEALALDIPQEHSVGFTTSVDGITAADLWRPFGILPSENLRAKHFPTLDLICRYRATKRREEREEREREKREKLERENAEALRAWIAGESNERRALYRFAYARINEARGMVETTQGAEAPLDHAVRLAHIWRRRTNARDVVGTRIGHFKVDAANGGLTIGCHAFSPEETERVCALLLEFADNA